MSSDRFIGVKLQIDSSHHWHLTNITFYTLQLDREIKQPERRNRHCPSAICQKRKPRPKHFTRRKGLIHFPSTITLPEKCLCYLHCNSGRSGEALCAHCIIHGALCLEISVFDGIYHDTYWKVEMKNIPGMRASPPRVEWNCHFLHIIWCARRITDIDMKALFIPS